MFGRFFYSLWRGLCRALKTAWVLALLITVILVALVWVLGPLVAVSDHILLESVVARLVATMLLIFCWGLFVVFYYARQRKKEQGDPEKFQARQKEDVTNQHFDEEARSLREKVKAAIKTVTTSNFYGPRSRSRYVLPWYLVLGVGNCGKTSLLLNSGLQFPLNEQADRHINQLKSTEQCEWMYANQAVLIDTPGKYTESRHDSAVHKIWLLLLRHLFRVRPSRPLNGIVVCVSMRDIIDADAARREHLARTIRTRLSEVLKRLHAYVPVYLIFTKCDAVPGFAQFFTHLSRAEREQIFGCPAQGESMDPGSVRSELKELMQTLNAQILSKVHQERDVEARGAMFRFPQELASLGSRLEDFIFEAFGPSRYHRPVLFRGFFFTSALSAQDVLASAAREGEYKFQTGFQPSLGDYAKGFFLLRLFQDFIIPEARLGAADKDSAWTLRFRRYGLQAAACVVFLLAGSFLAASFVNNYSRIDTLDKAYVTFSTEQKQVPKVTEAKLALPELLTVEKATMVYDPDKDSKIAYGLGLYQGKQFNKGTNSAYLGTLNYRLMPALRDSAAKNVDSLLDRPSELKSALQAYLMLCQPKYMNEKFIYAWLGRQWSEQYHGQANTQQALEHHMDYLMAHGIIPVEPDAALLERARKALLKIPLAELAYQRMQDEAAESGRPAFTFRRALGETMSPFDGDTYPISHLYTRDGYEEYLIKRCPVIIRNLTGESWIFGSSLMALSELDVNKVYKDVRAMYFRDYTKYWAQAVQSLSVRTPNTLADASKLSEQLTSGVSPVVLVLRELRVNSTLIIENSEEANVIEGELARKATQRVARKVGQKTAKVLVDKAKASAAQAAEDAQKDALAVRQYFVPLDSLLDVDGNMTPNLRASHDAMAATGVYFNKIATSDNREQRIFTALLEIADEKDDTLRRLESAAERLPSPVASWYTTVPSGGLKQMLAQGASYINRVYLERVVSVYNKDLRGQYPFLRNAEREANLDDFSAFFRNGGVLDNFNDAYLRPFISKNGVLRSIMGRNLPVSGQAVLQLQRANRVQEAFFTSGRDLGINFLLEPYAMDASLKQVTLSNADKSVTYWHGLVQGSSFAWPQAGGVNSQAGMELQDLNGISTHKSTRGEWALFRLFQEGTIKTQDGNTCLIEVQQNGKWAQFLIQFRNKINPFDPSVCSFNLPDSLI